MAEAIVRINAFSPPLAARTLDLFLNATLGGAVETRG